MAVPARALGVSGEHPRRGSRLRAGPERRELQRRLSRQAARRRRSDRRLPHGSGTDGDQPSVRRGGLVMERLPTSKLVGRLAAILAVGFRSEEHTSELQSLMRISYDVFCLKKKKTLPPLRQL